MSDTSIELDDDGNVVVDFSDVDVQDDVEAAATAGPTLADQEGDQAGGLIL